MTTPIRFSLLALCLAAVPVPAQAPASPTRDPALRAAVDQLRATNDWTLAQQRTICEIAAPPFHEAARAADMRRRFEALGLRHVRIDHAGNVIGERPGTGGGPVIVLSALKDRIAQFISVDGTGFSIVHRGVGSHRYRVHFTGPGGHSFSAFGMPDPIHAMGRAIAKIGDLPVPATPRTTFNVGVVSGGTSVNSIAGEGIMEVDMRSESPVALDSIDAAIRRTIAAAVAEERARWPESTVPLAFTIDTMGIRAASEWQDKSSPIVQVAMDAARSLGAGTVEPHAASTDANIALSRRIPAITIGGGGTGPGAHSLGETYDDGAEGWKGPQWVALGVTTLSGLGGVTP